MNFLTTYLLTGASLFLLTEIVNLISNEKLNKIILKGLSKISEGFGASEKDKENLTEESISNYSIKDYLMNTLSYMLLWPLIAYSFYAGITYKES